MKKKIVAISLFSGAGGLDLATQMAGISVISSLDFDFDSTKTLELNKEFKNTEVLYQDISTFDMKHYKDLLKKTKHDKFIVIGGPPCQPFSKAGYWIGNKSRKIQKDPRNMVGQYLRVISELNPDGFIFENVDSLLHPTNKIVVEELIKSIKSLKYHYRLIRANALDYGVSQKRRRIFIFGSKKEFKVDEPYRTHSPNGENGLVQYEGVGNVIRKFDVDKYFEKEEVVLASARYYKELKNIPPGKNYLHLAQDNGKTKPRFNKGTKFWTFLLKLDPLKPSWTIAAQPGPWVGPFHWTGRRLRIPEIAAIQTFPEKYKFYGTRRSVQKQIGNAVPPLMGKAMVEFLKENL